jgi:hypothetical protein
VNNTTAASGAGIFACRSRGTLAAPTIVQDNDNLATISFAGGDGVDLALAARISVEVDGTPGSNDMPGRMVFLTTPDGSQTPVEAMRINNAQNVTVSAGNLIIGTSGKGIDFSATPGTGTSELLNDYEEGVWTPGVSFGGGTTGITYTEQNGRYTKIGRQVTVTASVTLSSKGSSTGDAVLTGLPFTNGTARSTGSIYIAGTTFAGDLSILVEASNTIAYFRETTDLGVPRDLTNADFSNSSNWTATITYFV